VRVRGGANRRPRRRERDDLAPVADGRGAVAPAATARRVEVGSDDPQGGVREPARQVFGVQASDPPRADQPESPAGPSFPPGITGDLVGFVSPWGETRATSRRLGGSAPRPDMAIQRSRNASGVPPGGGGPDVGRVPARAGRAQT
jgi:hypothetical protein